MTSCMSWLVPAAGPVRDRLAGVIARLAAEHAAPVFAPHVTMAGVVECVAGRGRAGARAAGGGGAAVRGDADRESGMSRSSSARCTCGPNPMPVLTALHEAGERAWELDPAPYRPHLSLLYSQLPEERKPAIADALGLALPVTIRIDAAEVWADFRDDVTRWRRVARVRSGGLAFRGFSPLPVLRRLGTLRFSGSAPPARFRASDGPRRSR